MMYQSKIRKAFLGKNSFKIRLWNTVRQNKSTHQTVHVNEQCRTYPPIFPTLTFNDLISRCSSALNLRRTNLFPTGADLLVAISLGHAVCERIDEPMNIYPLTESPKKTCDRNSVLPLAIAVGNSDVRARGVYSTDAFLFTSYIYIHHFGYFLFLFD